MSKHFSAFSDAIDDALGEATAPAIEVHGEDALPSVYAVTDLAAASIGAAAAEVAAWTGERAGTDPNQQAPVHVDRRLASQWFSVTIVPDGWELKPGWDAIAGDYEGADGWIRLHTNAPHHRAAALRVLGAPADRQAVARAVSQWSVGKLEEAIVEAQGCAAAMRSPAAWMNHPQGKAVAREPLITWLEGSAGRRPAAGPQSSSPLKGVRVLDLTRVLAGPVATRFLAGWGADVLRLDPADWREDGVVPEVTRGKRCAHIDLRSPADLKRLEVLLRDADVLVHGYRPDALDRLGFGAARRQELRPGLVDVSLDAYGWTGPWAHRRGFDSLVQMSCGIAHEGMQRSGSNKPVPLPVQALDHATGYLMAAAAVRGLRHLANTGRGCVAHCSLARTACTLIDGPPGSLEGNAEAMGENDLSGEIEPTSWGPARRVLPPVRIELATMRWDRPAVALGTHAPSWL
jgi:hypothetical protein